ncbi:MAG: hypothetical protein AAB367_01560 [Patescibacteria group bacterium]
MLNNTRKNRAENRGHVAIFTVILFLAVSLVMMGTFSTLAFSQLRAAREMIKGKASFATAESGAEDLSYRALKALSLPVNGSGKKQAIVRLNGGSATAVMDIDGSASSNYPKNFELSSSGNVSSRFRNIKLRFEIPDPNLSVTIRGAIEAGYLGLVLGGDAQIHGTGGYGKGDVFSNGNIVSLGGRPVINGTATVAEGIGAIPQQIHNNTLATAPTCAGCKFQIRGNDLAQAFLSNTTAEILKIRLFMQRVQTPAAGIEIKIRRNMRVRKSDGATCIRKENASGVMVDYVGGAEQVAGVCQDFPATTGNDVASANFAAGVMNGATKLPNPNEWRWVNFDITSPGAQDNMTMDEKFWIVIDGQCLGCTTAYYEIGGVDGGYGYGGADKDGLVNVDYDTDQGDAPVLYSMTAWSLFPAPYPTAVTPAAVDLAFEVYMGNVDTEINAGNITDNNLPLQRGVANTGGNSLQIVGNAFAEKLRAVAVGGYAWYKFLDPAQPTGEVKAGGDYNLVSGIITPHVSPPNPYPRSTWVDALVLGKAYHDLDANQYVCHDEFNHINAQPLSNPPGIGVSNQAYKKPWASTAGACNQPRYTTDARWYCWDFYCSCNWAGSNTVADGPSDTDGIDDPFCQYIPTSPIDDPDDKIPAPTEPFGIKGKRLHVDELNKWRAMAKSMGVVNVAAEAPGGGTLTLNTPAGVPTLTEIPGTTPLTMTPNNWPIKGAYLDGNLTLGTSAEIRLTGYLDDATRVKLGLGPQYTGKCPYMYDTYPVGDSRRDKPCYVLWITGDLILNGEANRITVKLPSGNSPQISPWALGQDFNSSVAIVVEGKVVISGDTTIMEPPPSIDNDNAFYIVSLSPKTGDTDPAISLSGDPEGSTFFAYRGGIKLLETVKVKALAGQEIRATGNVKIFFDEGLRQPNEVNGTKSISGANITQYYEKQ